ncbi:protein similar isoform X1 [Anastrepha ludens]|uniref:protein similar isoform X1 n=1 Tax=Anastrepha ludens TaxID=28586 RepID=UPI0023B0ACEA|nr:protein similar isoform X1 [Anastrepha ludens]
MFENPNSWATSTFMEEAPTLYDDNLDKLLKNLCWECQLYECEHQCYEQEPVQELQQKQSEFAPEKKAQFLAQPLHSNLETINTTNQLFAALMPTQQQEESLSDFGFRSTCGCGDGKVCENGECALWVPQQYQQTSNTQVQSQSNAPQQIMQSSIGSVPQQHNVVTCNGPLQRCQSYQREEQSYGVTVYPPRNYPALEAVPGITYPIENDRSQNAYALQQELPRHRFQQPLHPLQQQHIQSQQSFQPPQQFIQKQNIPNQPVQVPQQYGQQHFSQHPYHEQFIDSHRKWLSQQPTARPSYPVHSGISDGCVSDTRLPSVQERSAGYYQQAPTGAPGVNVQRLLGHAPCSGNVPWSYSYCYGNEQNKYEPCHFIQCVDIEDFLNNEKRKEKSRDAARCRRSRETEIFSDLAQILPLRKEDVNQLDKASVMRIAIAFLKVREMLQLFPKIQNLIEDLKLDIDIDDNSNSATQMSVSSTKETNKKFDLLKCAEASQFIKQTLDGFLIILSNDGDITYVSDNITDYLGLAKIDILGQQIWEYSHQCDHAELKEALNIKRNGTTDKIKDENMVEEGLSTDHRDLFVRFKCTLTSRGRSINIKSASYKVIHVTGHLVVNMKGERVLIAIGRPIPHPSNIEIPLGSTTFLTKHSLDMKFTYVDDKMQNLFGYNAEDLLDQSLFACHHGGDSGKLMATFKSVLSKGQGETCRYRFLGKYGGYCWIVTQATIVYDKLKPQSFVCVNYVISNLENNNEIYSLAQYEASKLKVEESDSKSDQSNVSDSCSNNNKSENDNNNSNNINSADDDKNILKECTEKSKLEQELPHQEQEKIENQEILNKTCKVEFHSIKVANSPPAPKLISITDNVLNEDRSNNSNNNTNKLCTTIKREQSPTIVAKPNTTSDTPPLGNPSKSIDGNKTIVCEHSLSPLRRNLQSNCLIGNDNNANNKNKNNITNNPSNKNLLIPKLVEEKRPKSVTASVFRPATLADLSATQPTPSSPPLPPATTSTTAVFVNASNAALPPLNAAPRAQSVTASVFTSISQLCNKQQQYIAKTNSITTPTTVTAAILSGQQQHHHQQPQTQTRTQQQQQDMNKFLTFGDDATELTMLKEEPDDLAHLAPAAVDACMRLDDAAPFCGEMLLGLCSYSYGGFLPDDYSSLDSTTNSSSPDSPNHSGSNTNGNINNSSNNQHNNRNNKSNFSSPTHQQNCNSNLNSVTLRNNNNNNNNNSSISNTNRVDPFINYREESNDTNCSQHLLSPCVASKSPEASSLPSLCSPNSLSQDDGFAFMTMSVDEDIDMTMRAPYIPMNEQEDLPLLTADDLMWCASNGLGSEELNNQKDVDATLQQLQLQQQHSCESSHNLLSGYQDAQHITQSHLNSLCSSPASTVSSLSPSPVSQQQQQDTNCVYNTDTSELAALLCGSGSGTLSILNNNCGGGGGGNEQTGAGLQQQQEQAHQQQSHCGDFRLHQLQQDLAAEQQDQQQRQMQLLGLSIDCKKESSLSPSLCDSIEDAFDHVYNKDSTNLDCWNELLQINVNESSSSASPSPAASLNSPQQQRQEQTLTDCKSHLQLEQQLSPPQQQQQHQQHNIILNAVPLITIQNTKNILLQQQLQHNASNKMIINDEMLPANRGGNKITTIKLVNGQSTPTATAAAMTTVGTSLAASNGTTIRLIDGKLQQLLQQKQQQEETRLPISAKGVLAQQKSQQQQQQSHKRHLLSTLAGIQQETKRMKSTAAGMELHAVPQLLQQLVTPVQPQQLKEQEQKQQTRKVNGGVARWPTAVDAKAANGIQQQPQSNSVLKNLLISGCDTIIFKKPGDMLLDEDSLDQAPTPPLSGLSPSLTGPLHCQTSTATLLRDYRHNPMIGGPGVLPSPPFGSTSSSEESSPPGLTPVDSESTSDSGIDDIGIIEASSPMKVQLDNPSSPILKPMNTCSATTKDMLLIKCLNSRAAKKRAAMDSLASEPQLKQQQPFSSRSVDTGNDISPLMEPFIMDLCNDDYDVAATEQFLAPNEIENVLSDWTNEMA